MGNGQRATGKGQRRGGGGGAAKPDTDELSSCLRQVPPPCLGCGSESQGMLLGVSSVRTRGLLEGSLGFWVLASWVPLGFPGGRLGLPRDMLGASWGVLGALWGLLRGRGLKMSVRLLCLGV